jgi:CHAT domain-containing protein/Tfp pilus assembly protein PilF
MVTGQIGKHIEPESIFILALDEKGRTIPSPTRDQFLEHISSCGLCNSIFEEAKQDVASLETSGPQVSVATKKGLLAGLAALWKPLSIAAAGLLVVIGIVVVEKNRFITSPEGEYRGSGNISLRTPDDEAVVKTYQEFSWQGQSDSYHLIIRDETTKTVVVSVVSKQTSYILKATDSSKLVPNGRYEWSVQLPSGHPPEKEEWRHFTFSAPESNGSYRDFGEKERDEMLSGVRNDDPPKLKATIARTSSYLKNTNPASHLDRAWAYYVQGLAYYHSDQQGSGRDSMRAALLIWDTEGLPPEEDAPKNLYARALINYGLFSEDSGDLDASLLAYNRALSMLETKTDTDSLTRTSACLLNLGTLYRAIGNPAKAKDSYTKALAIDRQLGDSQSIADDLANLGNLFVDELEEPEQGVVLLEEARALREDYAISNGGKFDRNAATTFDGLGVAHGILGNRERALEYFRRSKAIDSIYENKDGMLATLVNEGELFVEDPTQLETARRIYEQALRIVESETELDPESVWRTYDGLGRIDLNAGDLDLAERKFNTALKIATSSSSSFDEKQFRRTFHAVHMLPSYSLALVYRRRGNAAKFFEIIESTKATSLRNPLPQQKSKPVMTLEEFQSSMEPTEAALIYFLGARKDDLLLFVVTKNEVSWYDLPSSEKTLKLLRQAVSLFRSRSNTEEAKQIVRTLAETLLPSSMITKLQGQNVRRLLINPDGELYNFPFEVLPTAGPNGSSTPLIRNFRVSLIPSFTWRKSMAEHSSNGPSQSVADALIVANPVIQEAGCGDASLTGDIISGSIQAGRKLQPLPATKKEADTVLTYASKDSTLLTEERANSQEFSRMNLQNYKIIHFATHAFSGGNLEGSTLLFGCRNKPDALSGAGVLKLALNGQLVVLSACETNVGSGLATEGNDSLAWGFLVAGAGSSVSTRWPVKDEASGVLIGFLYENLTNGVSVGEALHLAKIRYMDEVDDSLTHWPAFTAIGYDDMKLSLTPDPQRKAAYSIVWPNRVLSIVIVIVVIGVIVIVIGKFVSRRTTSA